MSICSVLELCLQQLSLLLDFDIHRYRLQMMLYETYFYLELGHIVNMIGLHVLSLVLLLLETETTFSDKDTHCLISSDKCN